MVIKLFKLIIKVILIVFPIVLLFNIYSLQREIKIYKDYNSVGISNNTQNVIRALTENHKIYNNIFEINEITHRQLRMLRSNNSDFLLSYQYNLSWADRLNRINEDYNQMQMLYRNMRAHSYYIEQFIKVDLPLEELDEKYIDLKVEDGIKEKLQYMHELNLVWLNALEKSVEEVKKRKNVFTFNRSKFQKRYDSSIISEHFWVIILEDIHYSYNSFLDKYGVKVIDELLIN